MQQEKGLVQRIVGGETALYAELTQRYAAAVYALTVRIVGNSGEAEEVAQDVFLKAYRALDRFDGRSSFSTWLHRIAYNTAISFARRHRANVVRLDEKQLNRLSDTEVEQMDDWAEREERLDALAHAVERLEAEERALVALFYYQQHSVEECATIMSLTASNVKVRLHRIRKKLYVLVTTLLDGKEN